MSMYPTVSDPSVVEHGFSCRVEKDSVSKRTGRRLTTFVVRYPRMIHSELMTHRAFSRNAESSRARPFKLACSIVEEHPFVPLHFGVEEGGMQCPNGLPPELLGFAEQMWLEGRDHAVRTARLLHNIGDYYCMVTGDDKYRGVRVHKSIPNRMIEPYGWITVIISATEFANFLRLRDHGDAEIHFQKLAKLMSAGLDLSTPVERQWHLPFVTEEGRLLGIGDDISQEILEKSRSGSEDASILRPENLMPKVFLTDNVTLQRNFYQFVFQNALYERIGGLWSDLPGAIGSLARSSWLAEENFSGFCQQVIAAVSTARCSRVSYLKQGKTPSVWDDLQQFIRLFNGSGFGHWSPHEHVGIDTAASAEARSGNFVGWTQWRKTWTGENLPG